jgi:hypothetical protein
MVNESHHIPAPASPGFALTVSGTLPFEAIEAIVETADKETIVPNSII